jgi:hypothetical protein
MRRHILTSCLLGTLVLGSVCTWALSKEKAEPSPGQDQGDPAVKVWVNTKSHLYHCPDTPAYGHKKPGEYLTQEEALRAGDHPADGLYCSQAGGTVAEPGGFGAIVGLVLIASILAFYFLAPVMRVPLYGTSRLMTARPTRRSKPAQQNETPALTPTWPALPTAVAGPLGMGPYIESIIDDYFVLAGGPSFKGEATRRYPFHLLEPARLKGDFSSIGNVTVSIPGGYYSTDGPVAAATFDLLLPAGTYVLVISAIELAAVSLHLLAASPSS